MYGHLSAHQWNYLWETRQRCQMETPFLQDIIWCFPHQVLPTEPDLHRWKKNASPKCIVLQLPRDTIDHAFDACCTWQQNLHGALSLLMAMNISICHLTFLHPFDLLQTNGCLSHCFALLIAIYTCFGYQTIDNHRTNFECF